MVLRAGYLHLAVKLQEASGDAMHSDVRARLADAINDAHRGTGHYGNYIDHSGDGESGDVVYSCDGDIRSAPYEMSSANGKAVTTVDTDNSKNVVPMTTYQEEADDDDHYASMEEAYKRAGLYTALPLYERFIGKSERDAADENDFAGKGKSYPILKPDDVQAAVHAMGRAGDKNVGMSTLKSRIIAIAKRKGWTKYLPKSWQGGGTDTSEADVPRGTSKLALVESWDWKQDALDLVESNGSPVRMKLKLIQAGEGSSAFYPAEVLKRDGPKVFTKGTHIYINHPTSAEEAARPEGDWHKLAGALDDNAYWDDNGPKGPALYGEALFTSDHAPLIKEKAPFTGMSIRASGVAESGKQKNGKPVLKELTSAESVDVVTRAGAGGMILTEAARPGNNQEVDMTETEVNRLIETARVKWNAENDGGALKKLQERALKGDATVSAGRLLAPLALNEAQKQFIVENVLREALPIKDGALDEKAFEGLVTTEAKRVAALLGVGLGEVHGMGTGTPGEDEDDDILTKKRLKEAKRQRKLAEADHEEEVAIFESLGMPKDAATFAAKGRAA